MGFAYRRQRRVGEQAVAALGEGAPRLDPDAEFVHEILVGDALEEGMGLDLVDGRDDLVVVDQVDEPVGEEVRYADRADSPFGVELLHGPPRSVVVAEGLVDEVQVQRLQAEFVHRTFEGLPGRALAGVGDPQFRRDEQVVARDAAGGDGAAHRFLVVVHGGRVDRAIAGLQGLGDGPLGLLGRDLVDAEAEDRHADAVVECYTVHWDSLSDRQWCGEPFESRRNFELGRGERGIAGFSRKRDPSPKRSRCL